MPGTVTVDSLAVELKRQGRLLAAQTKILQSHMDGCGKLQERTAETLKTLAEGQALISKHFETIDQIRGGIEFVVKYGKIAIGSFITAAIGAFATILVTAYSNHLAEVRAATNAAEAAQSAAVTGQQVVKGQQQIIQKLNEAPPN